MINADEVFIHLYNQLDRYPYADKEHGVINLSEPSRNILDEGIKQYQQKNQYDRESNGDKTYSMHRINFIEHIIGLTKNLNTNYNGDQNLRETNPEKVTIKAEALLGKEGLRLYRLAIEEEVYSNAYRNAVFNKSTQFIAGKTWNKAPIIIIAAPSASGKTYATSAVIKQIEGLPKSENDSGNLVICIDGGICREISQMRKLAIRVANIKGYTGIADLHEQSSELEKVKQLIKRAALEDNKFGLAIPETYAGWINPFGGEKAFLSEIARSDQRTLIFARVIGQNEQAFQEVVYHMGTRRAWKTTHFENIILDLNSTVNLTESKAYGPSGFSFGKYGSQKAYEAYVAIQQQNQKPNLSMVIVNDLILLRQVTDQGPLETWAPAKTGEKEVLIISAKIYTQWEQQRSDMGLVQYNELHSNPIIIMSPDCKRLLEIDAESSQIMKQRLQSLKGDELALHSDTISIEEETEETHHSLR